MPLQADKHDIEQVLAQRAWLLPIPPSLRAAYEQRRHEGFAKLVDQWSPMLGLAFLGCLLLTVGLHWPQLQGADLRVFAWSEAVAIALGTAGVMLAHGPRWQTTADHWIPLFYGLIIVVKVAAGFQLNAFELQVNQIYITLVVVIIGTLALQLSLRSAVVGCLIGLTPFVLAPWFVESPRYAWVFLAHYLLTTAVCLFVSVIREDKERAAFLQGQLLELERRQVQHLNDELEQLARRDPLTGLANRRLFDEACAREWERARRQRSEVAVLMIDVDHFKAYNDHHGHPAGDRSLSRVAEAIASAAHRPTDVVARYGGEEFVVLLPDTGGAGAAELARRIIDGVDALGLPHQASPVAPHVTVSVGVSSARVLGHEGLEALLSRADQALYRAKLAGRHGLHVQEPGPVALVS